MQTGKNRCEWVGIGLVWVYWGEGSMGGTKTINVHTKMIVHALIWALWPGKFPRTSCFVMEVKKIVQVGADGYK